MYGIGYISPSVNQTLTPSATLGAPGDMYIITDTRQRPRKDLSETKAFQRFDIEPYDGSEMPLPNENGVVLFPVKDLNFDTANFQNRDSEFSETSVNRILDAVDDGDFNWAIFDPITIWRNPDNGKFYVLSGHSRSEAFRRLSADGASVAGRNFDRIPAKVFAGTFEQAKELALNSNTLSTKETDLERANYYRERREKFAANGLKNSEIKKRLLELARKNEGKNATKIIYLSHLNPRGSVVDAVAATSDGASVDKNRVAVMAEWVGHLRYDFPQLTDFHEKELFDFLKNGHYGVDVRNFNDFAKRVQTAIEKHTEWGVFNADKSLNLEKNLGKSENEKRFDAELDRLKSEWADAENILNRKLAEFKARQKRDASITDQQILQAVQPYKDAAILAKAAYFAFRDKRGDFLRADEAQMSLFGLGKPTIKFEFEDNAALADFLHATRKAADFTDFEDVTNTATSAKGNSPKSKIRNGRLMPADDSRYLPESPAPYSLPPTNTPPQLPTSPTSTAKALPPYVEPTTTPTMPEIVKPLDVENNGFSLTDRSGDLPYIDVYFPAQTSINDWFAWADQQYGKNGRLVTLVEIIEPKDGNKKSYKFYFQKKDKMEVLKYLLNPSKYEETFNWIIIRNLADIRRINHGEGSNVHLTIIKPHLVENNQVIEPTTPEVEPQPEPTTPTNPNAFDTPDWDAITKTVTNSYHWNSFDPESSAAYAVKNYKNLYNWALERLPEDRKKDFTTKFISYVYEIARLNAAAPSAAVTGRGGISAKQAAKYNAANDRYMEKRAGFSDWVKNYVDRANRIEEREMKAAMSSEQKFDARFEEIKKNIDYLAKLLQYRGQVPSYSITNARQNLQSKIENEASKGNVELVERLLEYMKPLNVYTNRSSIWTLADRARKRVAQNQAQEAQFEEQNADETSGYKVEFDTNEDRVKIYFDSIPSEQIRTWLKQHNFRWSPRNSAWQRQITVDSRYVINEFNKLMKNGTLSGLGKPTIKLEFEDNGELMSLFDTDGINGMPVNDKPADIFNCPESQLQTRGYKPTYIRLNDYSHLIDTADGRKTLKGYGFESATLDELVNACRYYPQVAALAAHLKDPNGDPLQTAFNDWHWLHTNIRYDYDTPGEEEIRTPARVWADRYKGVDCDCLAVMTACLLINQGFKPRFEIVAFNGEPTFSHIYVNLDGAAIDRVLPTFLARPDNITKTQIMDIPVYALSGIGGCRDTLSGVYASTLAKIQSGNATADDNNQFRKTQVLVTLRGVNDAAYQLAALLMPYVVTVSDDGTYYFDSTALANLATKLDDDLRQLIADDADPETISQWIATAAQQIDGAASVQSNGGKDTIVVIINPQGNMTRVIGQMVKASTPTLTATTAAATSAAQTPAAATAAETPAIMQTSPAPGISPDGEPATEDKSNAGWWLFGILATAGIAAAASDGKKKNKKRR